MKTNVLVVVSPPVILRMRNVSDKFVQKIETHILCSVKFFFPIIVPLVR